MRLYNEKVELDSKRVQEFFEARGRHLNPAAPLTSVLYQDRNPELAEARDAFEKGEVLPLLRLQANDSVLDLGCGIGRWADVLVGGVERYHGVDFSASLISQAQARHATPHFSFQQLAVEDVSLSRLEVAADFTRVLISGVLLYLNDVQLESALLGAAECAGPGALLYVREPVAAERRLTLKEYWSEDLESSYNAIYRTSAELLDAFERTVESAGFRLLLERDLYPPHLNNRRETLQRIFLFERA